VQSISDHNLSPIHRKIANAMNRVLCLVEPSPSGLSVQSISMYFLRFSRSPCRWSARTQPTYLSSDPSRSSRPTFGRHHSFAR
jgi:hypothetical protein